MQEIFHHIPVEILRFFQVLMFSFLIGLEQRRHHINDEPESLFGTDRTFTLIGILGFILYIIDSRTLAPFLGGGAVVSMLLGLFYWQKAAVKKKYGITSLVIALITYCIAPLVFTQPDWLVLLIVVSVLILTELKETLFEFSRKFDKDEFIILAKFLILTGVVLPLLPDTPISETINISPYKFWLSIVGVSGLSYLSYLLKKFVFPKSGIILTGILGGLYSSTATTIILAKKSKDLDGDSKVVPAIMLATAMMYLRVFLLAVFFNMEIAIHLIPFFAILIAVSIILAIYFFRFTTEKDVPLSPYKVLEAHGNPLEIKTAVIFAALFIFFSIITGFVHRKFGTGGINALSFIVGVTDIDPFILNLFQTKMDMANSMIVVAVLNAISSNNLIKMIYGMSLSSKTIRMKLLAGFGILVIIGLIMSFFFQG